MLRASVCWLSVEGSLCSVVQECECNIPSRLLHVKFITVCVSDYLMFRSGSQLVTAIN